MPTDHERAIIEAALAKTAEINPQESDGKWLETVVAEVAPFIKAWDVEMAWQWADWPHRAGVFPDSTARDVGVDVVARRRVDGAFIAIQCKSRKLDESERGFTTVNHSELTNFTSPASSSRYAEAWLVSNGDVQLASGARDAVRQLDKPLNRVNITADLETQRDADRAESGGERCAHCENPEDPDAVQTKSCMQREAIAESVRILREHAGSDSGGSPVGEARGRIILPCGTGKTRISLRIVEELTPPGEVSIVLCPSIALVAQIRGEYLQHRNVPLDVLAVCSDVTAGYNPKKEGVRNSAEDPTVDGSNVSADEVKGRVTPDAAEIAAWMREPSRDPSSIKVLIGTYQSGARVSEALLSAGVRARVLIADEAHRTAGLKRRRRRSNSVKEKAQEELVRDFTVCHDGARFPATCRVYQTATPRIYDVKGARRNDEWIVRSMDDEETFGVELYRKSYAEAVRNEWLSDYRIIALGINDEDAYAEANALARNTQSKGNNKLTTDSYMKGLALALAMGGATQGGDVDIRSCIAFMNTVDKSKNMARDLDTQSVKDWVSKWLGENADGRAVSDYSLEHLDASSNVAARETAKARLARADSDNPHGIINVGIFGEGTDSPSLSAVAFLEPRKSPIDVVQAVGRAMRTAPGKKLGYIICPILIPPNADPENFLRNSDDEEGWRELGQILLALRAHDRRIEDELGKLLSLYLPKPPEVERSIIAVALPYGETESDDEGGEGDAAPSDMENAAAARIQYVEYEGEIGAAEEVVKRLLEGESMSEVGARRIGEAEASYRTDEPTQVFTGKKNADGGLDIRMDTVVRDEPKANAARGVVNIRKTKASARKIINGEGGTPVKPGERRQRRKRDAAQRATPRERAERRMQAMLLDELGEFGSAIKVNLLAKSGLKDNRVMRDLNILEESVGEAARHLRADGLLAPLNRHFGLDRLKRSDKKSADGCTIAALLMMNAAMLHQRIVAGRWLSGVRDLAAVKNDVNAVRAIDRQWRDIMSHDFLPVLKPAVDAIAVVEDTRKLAGLERALRHVAAEAERIAETYADMGADHAGPLFNRVMGNQASDGAFFTRPVAASLAARLTLDAVGETNWTNPAAWRELKTVDLACGSGTLLAAILTDMKRRAKDAGANEAKLAELQKIAVEETVKGMDINPVSLQLAASQLTAGNRYVRYRRMGLHQMPYGPDRYNPGRASAGTLELLGQKAIVSRPAEMGLTDDAIDSQTTWGDADLEDAVDAAKYARIVIMNPPYTNRVKMGEKFTSEVQRALRDRADQMERKLIQADPALTEFTDKRAIRPLFVGLADHCVERDDGVFTMINPTIALTAPSGLKERQMLAQRYHIHTVLTCHQPGNVNMSQNTGIHESVVVMRRCDGHKPPTRFISLDKLPTDEDEIVDFHHNLLNTGEDNLIANGWGEVTSWDSERIEVGDWTPAIWRSPSLANIAYEYANHPSLTRIADMPSVSIHLVRPILTVSFERAVAGALGSIPVIASKGADGQTTIKSASDEYRIPKKRDEEQRQTNGGTYPESDKILQKAGHLLITVGQNNGTARVTAIASDSKYVGIGWMPVTGFSEMEAKAVAVFLNSAVGRIQFMRNQGKTLVFPEYTPMGLGNIRIPNIKDARIQNTLAACWERTKDTPVPQFRDGEAPVRRLWDEAVAEAMGWDADELGRLRRLLHREPHVRGLGYNQYADAP